MNQIPAVVSAGSLFEQEIFGPKAVFDPKVLEAYRRYPTKNFKDFKESLDEVKLIQDKFDWNPQRPSTLLGDHLYTLVQSHLREEFKDDLRLYCAIGTRLDYFHGVDGFFGLRNAIFTFDLTVSDKGPKENVDITIRKTEDVAFNLVKAAKHIAGILQVRV